MVLQQTWRAICPEWSKKKVSKPLTQRKRWNWEAQLTIWVHEKGFYSFIGCVWQWLCITCIDNQKVKQQWTPVKMIRYTKNKSTFIILYIVQSLISRKRAGINILWKKSYDKPRQHIKRVVIVQLLSCVQLFGTPWTVEHTTFPCPSLSPGACSNSRLLSQWCHPPIPSSEAPFSSWPQSFPLSRSFLISWLFIHMLFNSPKII